MEYKGYKGTVEYSAEDRTYHGRLAHVRNTVLYEAGSELELAQNFRKTVDEYLAFPFAAAPDAPRPGS